MSTKALQIVALVFASTVLIIVEYRANQVDERMFSIIHKQSDLIIKLCAKTKDCVSNPKTGEIEMREK